MSETERREELREFLKERRARVSPADVGLPSGPRRRVAGLRREEVATLAGIGVSWYTELENGDARGVSAETLHAVADALRLSKSEREYLIEVAAPSHATEDFGTPTHLAIATMNALSFPAYLITPTWEVIDCNAPFRRVWALEADESPPFNAVERLFLDARARALHGADYIENIRPVIAMVRSSQGRRPHVASLRALRDRIETDDELREIWNDYEIVSPRLSNSCTIHSSIGVFRYETLTMPISDRLLGLVVHVPDARSAERLKNA